MIPTVNQIYKHFKGNLYRIITIAKDSETGEDVVVYQALYGEYITYTRPLINFMEVLDRDKYPAAAQIHRFEQVQEMIEPILNQDNLKRFITSKDNERKSAEKEKVQVAAETQTLKKISLEEEAVVEKTQQEKQKASDIDKNDEEEVILDPMLEAYLDADSYRERLNILHGLQHRITEHMLLTMAVVIDFELPEGSIVEKYDALHDCLCTRERYECNRMI